MLLLFVCVLLLRNSGHAAAVVAARRGNLRHRKLLLEVGQIVSIGLLVLRSLLGQMALLLLCISLRVRIDALNLKVILWNLLTRGGRRLLVLLLG